MTYHAKVIGGGKIVIPAELRRTLGVRDGDTVMIEEQDGALILRTGGAALRKLQAEVRKRTPPGVDLVEDLLAERRREVEIEQQRGRTRR